MLHVPFFGIVVEVKKVLFQPNLLENTHTKSRTTHIFYIHFINSKHKYT